MNKLGIRAHDVGTFSAEELSKKVKDLGFDGVQLVFKKALNDEVDFNKLETIKNAFNEPFIMMLGAYFNPVHPDQNEVKKGMLYFKKHLSIVKSLGCKYVGTETGSYQGTPWTYHPLNHTYDAMYHVVGVLKELSLCAKEHDAYVAVEGAYQHVAYSPERLKEILDQVQSDHLFVIVDLFNYLHIGNYEERNDIFERALALFKEKIVIFHLKDFIVSDNRLVQVGLGQGLMDYSYLIKRIQETNPNAYLIFEGVVGQDIKTSYDLIRSRLKKEL